MREAKNAALKTPQSKNDQNEEITDTLSKYGVLNMARSLDPTMNVEYNRNARMVLFKLKMFYWLLKHRRACAIEKKDWKRQVRWLEQQQGRDLAAIWGHIGVASREVEGPKDPTPSR